MNTQLKKHMLPVVLALVVVCTTDAAQAPGGPQVPKEQHNYGLVDTWNSICQHAYNAADCATDYGAAALCYPVRATAHVWSAAKTSYNQFDAWLLEQERINTQRVLIARFTGPRRY